MFVTPDVPFAEQVAERVLQDHPTNLKCLSKFSITVKDPNAYKLIGNLMASLKQIGPRVTEFRAVRYYNSDEDQEDQEDGPFKSIEQALE
jgi:hypothetical protein